MTTNAPPALSTNLCFLLSRASHVLETELTAALAGFGISPRAHHVLTEAIAGDLTQSELAERCALDKTTMVVTLDELERAGLAERRVPASDRRARIVVVTEAGQQLVAEAQRIIDRIHADVLAALPDAERTAFIEGLARLVGGRLSAPVQCERPVRRPRVSRSPSIVP
jgi:DNA-binding MarR family transcriptional regulator